MGILAICKVSVGVGPALKEYFFQGSSSYAGLEAETGVSVVPAADWKNQEPLIQIGNLIRSGKVDRKIVAYKTSAGDKKSTSLVFEKSKVAAAESPTSAIVGKAYKVNGVSKGTITEVRNKRARTNKY
jgi:hypothetical protein